MKKIYVIATMVAATVFASCDNTIDVTPIDPASGPQVEINFGTDGQTRAFFDASATGEEWENVINSLGIYVYDRSGKFIYKHSLSAEELEAKSIRFALPPATAKTSCTFFAIANHSKYVVSTGFPSSSFEGWTFSESLEQNGTFGEVTSGSKRPEGFVMTDKVTAPVASLGSSTTVTINLKRMVAKVAVRIALDEEFKTTIEDGKFTLNAATISNAYTSSYIFYKGTYPGQSQLFEFTQAPAKNEDYYEALFYIYENGSLDPGSRVMLTLTGSYDADNDDTTTDDRTNLGYKIELKGTPRGGAFNGEIVRNGYYRVNAVIKGLAGDGVTTNYAVANWAIPVDQTENPGS